MKSSRLNIEKEIFQDKGLAVLLLTGPIGSSNVNLLEDAIKDLFDAGIFKLAIDCSSVGYIASTGIALLGNAAVDARTNGGMIVLFQPPATLLSILELCGVQDFFKITENRLEALALLSGFSGAPPGT